MKCHHAQDLLYLYRPGELTGKRRQELEEHLASCHTCATELNAALELEKEVSDIRQVEPRIEDPAHLLRTVMRATTETGQRPAESGQRPAGFLGTLPEWTATPAFRIAACVALFVISGTFFLQTSLDARKVATLERRLKSLSTTSGTIDQQNFQRAGLFLSGTDRITALPESLGVAVTEIRQWQKEPAAAAILLTLFGRQTENGTSIIDYLAKKHPRLASVRIDDGFDDREREILASEGEAFLKDVESLIQKGDVHHDR
jgi:hypothetical protein